MKKYNVDEMGLDLLYAAYTKWMLPPGRPVVRTNIYT